MNEFNPAYRQHLAGIAGGLAPKVGSFEAAQKAPALLAQSLQQQASVLSYIDAFRTIAILALVCVPLVFLLRKATNASGPMAAH